MAWSKPDGGKNAVKWRNLARFFRAAGTQTVQSEISEIFSF
jgi:hypothetical protein